MRRSMLMGTSMAYSPRAGFARAHGETEAEQPINERPPTYGDWVRAVQERDAEVRVGRSVRRKRAGY